jgi:hypothetical protein
MSFEVTVNCKISCRDLPLGYLHIWKPGTHCFLPLASNCSDESLNAVLSADCPHKPSCHALLALETLGVRQVARLSSYFHLAFGAQVPCLEGDEPSSPTPLPVSLFPKTRLMEATRWTQRSLRFLLLDFRLHLSSLIKFKTGFTPAAWVFRTFQFATATYQRGAYSVSAHQRELPR